VRAIVLAAGMATRLSPLSSHVPKALVPVANQPILGHELMALRDAGVTQVGITYGPATRLLAEYFGDGRDYGMDITWLWEPAPLGTGGALRHNREFFGGEPVMVVPADILLEADLPGVMAQHRAQLAGVTLVVAPRDLTRWAGDVVVAEGTRGTAYHFKPGRDVGSDLGSCGTWIVEPAVLDLIPDGFVDFSSGFLPRLPTAGCSLGVYHAGDVYQRDFGEFWSFHAGNLEVISGRACVPLPAGTDGGSDPAVARGPVLIGEDAVIEPGAKVYGPAVIGPAAVVSAGSQVVASVVLPGARIPVGMLAAHGVFGDPAGVTAVMMRYRDGWSRCPGQLLTTSSGAAGTGAPATVQEPAA
jgi:NDP-sugar pyrophosphorylase family protein